MSSTLRAVQSALVSAFQAIDGTGTFTHNLSATGVVQVGVPTLGDGPVPGLWVHFQSMDGARDADLGAYRRTVTFLVEGRVAASSGTLQEQSAIAMDLLSDLLQALEADPTLGGLVQDIETSGAAVVGDLAGVPGIAVAGLVIETSWIIQQGVGS